MSNQEWSSFDKWLKEHPYLKEIGSFHRVLSKAIEGFDKEQFSKDLPVSDLEEIKQGYSKGVPLLSSLTEINMVTGIAGSLFKKIVNALLEADLPSKTLEQVKALRGYIEKVPDLPRRLIRLVIKGSSDSKPEELESVFNDVNEGFVNFLAWSSLSAILEPLREVTGELLEEKPWRKGYCPLCGHLPAMGQLIRTKRGRERELICGCCKMKWTYRRIGCPYCGNENVNTLKLIEFVEMPEMRLDTCEECKAYVKTYINQGNEQVALADWSTLHLDLIGKNKGFQRVDEFFYEL